MGRVGQDGAGPAGRRQEVVMGGAVQRPSGGAVRRKVGYGCSLVFVCLGGEGGPRSRGGAQKANGDAYQREFGHRTPSRILGNGCFILHRGRTPRSSQSTTKSLQRAPISGLMHRSKTISDRATVDPLRIRLRLR